MPLVLSVIVVAVILTVASGLEYLFTRAPPAGDGVRVEILAVGTELLLGQIANTNARWMSEALAGIGADVLHHQVVGDNLERIVEAIRLSSSRADVVIVTGGLGPTQDDITRDALAVVMSAPMVRHPELEDLLREKFRAFGRREMPESNLRQADVPEGARYLTPSRGTAPGLVADLPDGTRIYAVPGVPEEMVEMMEGTILPELAESQGGVVRSRVLRCAGIGESALAERVDDLFSGSTNPSIAFLASSGEVKVRVTAKAGTAEEAERLIDPIAEEVRARIGDDVFTSEDETLEQSRGPAARGERVGRSRAPSRSPVGEWGRVSPACRARRRSSSDPRSSTATRRSGRSSACRARPSRVRGR